MLRRELLRAPLLLTDGADSIMRAIYREEPADPLEPPAANVLEHFPREEHMLILTAISRASGKLWRNFGVWGEHPKITVRSIVGLNPDSQRVEFLPPQFFAPNPPVR